MYIIMKNRSFKKRLSEKRNIHFLRERIKMELLCKHMPKTLDEISYFNHHPTLDNDMPFILVSKNQIRKQPAFNKILSDVLVELDKKDPFGAFINKRKRSNTKFTELSNRMQRIEYKEMAKLIQSVPFGNQLFYTDQCVTDSKGNKNYDFDEQKQSNPEYTPTRYFYSMDFYFLSKKYHNVFYNAAITTSFADASELQHHIEFAQNKIKKIQEKDANQVSSDSFAKNMYQVLSKKPLIDDNYFLQSYQDDINYFKKGISTHPAMFAGYIKKQYNYCHGVGLHITIADKQALTVEDIEQFILDFYENGENEINPELENWIQYVRYPKEEANQQEKIDAYYQNVINYVNSSNYQTKIVGHYTTDILERSKKESKEYRDLMQNIKDCNERISIIQKQLVNTKEIATTTELKNNDNYIEDESVQWKKTHIWSHLRYRFLACLETLDINHPLQKYKYHFFMWLYGAERYSHYGDLVNPNLSVQIVKDRLLQISPLIYDDFKESLDWWEENSLSSTDEQQTLETILSKKEELKQYFLSVICAFALARVSIKNEQNICAKNLINDELFQMFWLDETLHHLFLDCLNVSLANNIQTLYNHFFYDKLDFEQFFNSCSKRLESYSNIDNATHDKVTNRLLNIHDGDNKNESNYISFDDNKQNQLIAQLDNLLIEKEQYIKEYDSYWMNANKKYNQ